MALIDQKPEGLDSTNALDDIPDDLLGGPPSPAVIKLSNMNLAVLADPPGPGEDVVLLVRLRVYDIGTAYGDNGEGEPSSPYRKTKLIACWKPGTKEPQPKKTQAEQDAEAEAEAAKDQPPLFGDGADPEVLGDIAGELLGEELGDAAGVEFDGGPAFSDGE